MSSLISKLSPIPAFPEYTGPYQVGTADVEIPVSQLNAPSQTPAGAADIHTVQFRIFYPAVPEPTGKRITWLPAPQRLHVTGYTQFLGIGPLMGSVLSYVCPFSTDVIQADVKLQPASCRVICTTQRFLSTKMRA